MSAKAAPKQTAKIVCPKCGHDIFWNRGEITHAGFTADAKISVVCANYECGEKFLIPIGHMRDMLKIVTVPELPF